MNRIHSYNLKEIEGVGWCNEILMAPDRPLEISLEINKTSTKMLELLCYFTNFDGW